MDSHGPLSLRLQTRTTLLPDMTIGPRRPDFSDVPEARRRNMSAISGKNTWPELVVRRLAHRMGYRFRLHVNQLPGRPDLVFPGRLKLIELRGCFWHRHPGCVHAATPKTRPEFWQAKFDGTVARDARNVAVLEAAGWKVLVIWECEVVLPTLESRLRNFLGPPGSPLAIESSKMQDGLSGGDEM